MRSPRRGQAPGTTACGFRDSDETSPLSLGVGAPHCLYDLATHGTHLANLMFTSSGRVMAMRLISTRVHGVMDYPMAFLIGTMPWWAGTHRGGPETWIPVALGIGIALISAMTDYELSVSPIIPMSAHLGADVLGGLLLASSPWLFGFADISVAPYLGLGLLEIGLGLCTRSAPDPALPGAKSPPIGGRLGQPKQ